VGDVEYMTTEPGALPTVAVLGAAAGSDVGERGGAERSGGELAVARKQKVSSMAMGALVGGVGLLRGTLAARARRWGFPWGSYYTSPTL
jgi:hypothetical protein